MNCSANGSRCSIRAHPGNKRPATDVQGIVETELPCTPVASSLKTNPWPWSARGIMCRNFRSWTCLALSTMPSPFCTPMPLTSFSVTSTWTNSAAPDRFVLLHRSSVAVFLLDLIPQQTCGFFKSHIHFATDVWHNQIGFSICHNVAHALLTNRPASP